MKIVRLIIVSICLLICATTVAQTGRIYETSGSTLTSRQRYGTTTYASPLTSNLAVPMNSRQTTSAGSMIAHAMPSMYSRSTASSSIASMSAAVNITPRLVSGEDDNDNPDNQYTDPNDPPDPLTDAIVFLLLLMLGYSASKISLVYIRKK